MRFFTSLFLVAAGCTVAFADVISEDQALANAGKFIEQSSSQSSLRRIADKRPQLTKAMQSRGFYAFNINGDAGYIITSGSDLTQPVLGYSDQGSLDPDNMPDALKYWLETLDSVIGNIEAGVAQEKALTANSVARVADKKAIEPLVKCKWNQGYPYNLMTPSYIDQNSGNFNEHSATGCVATATSQIMYYWKWPQEACSTIPSYTYNWSGNNKTTEELPPVVFNWDAMTDTYDNNSSEESRMAVAELMVYAGHGMKSGYAGATGATSGNALNALKNYFGYTQKAYNVGHLNYTFQEWEDLFYNELAAGRPILMGADNYERTGGHEFVCDGYDGKGLYHINWGWGGYQDGYFVLTVMAPDSQGIGGSTDANGYSMGQNICVNLRPEYYTPDEETVRASISGLSSTQTKINEDEEGVYSLRFNYTLRTILLNQYNFEHAFRLVSADDESVVADELSVESRTISPTNRFNLGTTVKMSNLANGKYVLRGISREMGADEWFYDDNTDRNCIELTVEDGVMSVVVLPGKGSSLVVNSMKLEGATVGGNWQKVVYNITNTGNDFYGETYLFVDGVRSSGNTISIRAGETVDVYYKFKPSNAPGAHNFILSRATNTGAANVISNIDRMYNLDCQWNADGTVTTLPKVVGSQSYVIPETAVALYVYGSTPRNISVSKANPNVVIYYDEDVELSTRVENNMRKYVSNIVFGKHAKEAGFKDGYKAAVPIAFTADKAVYTRENMTEWSTVALPFDVDEITVDGEPVDWFTSKDDTGKNLFVKQFTGNRSTQLYFAHSEEMKANTPYLVGLKGDFNGSSFDHTGKNVTFTGHNVIIGIEGENTSSFVAKDVKFLPCYDTTSSAKLLGLDDTLENFVPVQQTEPFKAYVSSTFSQDCYTIRYEEGEKSGIEEIIIGVDDNISPETSVYNMQGIKVGTVADFDSLERGLYIVAGRKVAK